MLFHSSDPISHALFLVILAAAAPQRVSASVPFPVFAAVS
jgi:hypothetical protein